MLKGCLIGPVVGVALGLLISLVFVFVLATPREPSVILHGFLFQLSLPSVRYNLGFCALVGFAGGWSMDSHTRKPPAQDEEAEQPKPDENVWPPPPSIPPPPTRTG
jgi:hypothetical protein